MRHLSVFSGIGGDSLGLKWAGMETVAFCEFDKKCQLVLKKHWPGVPIFDDIRKLNAERLKHLYPIDIISGGFPCQGHSVAGKRKGKEDDRYLWPEYFRIIQEIRPRWVIVENVTGIISDLVLDQVLSDLESEDYSCQTFIIPACAVNAPHRRDRVWIVGHTPEPRGGNCGNRQTRMAGDLLGAPGWSESADPLERSGANVANTNYQREPQPQGCEQDQRGWTFNASEDVPDSNSYGCGGVLRQTGQGKNGPEQRTDPNRKSVGTGRLGATCQQDVSNSDQVNDDSGRHGAVPVRRKRPEEAEIFRGKEGGGNFWTIESGMGGLADGLSSGLDGHWDREPNIGRVATGVKGRVDKLKQLGNAVVPQVVEVIGRAIMEIEKLYEKNS